jgi:hypothetical protein
LGDQKSEAPLNIIILNINTMIYNEITKLEPEEFEKEIFDVLRHIEIETTIRFDRSTLEGIFAWITYDTVNKPSRTVCMPAEFYWVNSKNYSIRFKMRYCPCENCQKVVNIEPVLTNSLYEQDLEDVTLHLEDMFYDVSI